MKNEKGKIFRNLLIILCISLLIIILFLNISYKRYKESINQFAYNIVGVIKEKYPDVSEQEIIEILNQEKNFYYDNLFSKYGIDKESSVIYNLENNFKKDIYLGLGVIILIWFLFVIYFSIFFRKKEKGIEEITNYLKEINQKNYKLDIANNSEGSLSILKNEVYKITIMLREESENLKKERLLLKDSISDISHQLKTPLTSILILFDNVLDTPNMDEKTKIEFITNAQHQIENIHFLIISMLKLSRIDANVVEFKKEKVNVQDLFKKAIKNLDLLCEIKKVSIRLTNFKDIYFTGDFNWELEAMTNILKNAVEYSKENGFVDVLVSDNNLYTKIIIKDYGAGMDKKDLKNIFKRFYKGVNSTKDSFGIGLNLAHNIIEKDNGYITVNSIKDVGTSFEIKFIK